MSQPTTVLQYWEDEADINGFNFILGNDNRSVVWVFGLFWKRFVII